jgi:hypothetical protein
MSALSIRNMNATMIELEQIAWRRGAERKRRHEFTVRWNWAMRCLRRLDPDWMAWYDSRPEQTKGEMLPLICERVAALKEQAARQREDTEARRDAADMWAAGHGR